MPDPAEKYASDVEAGRILAGAHMRAAARRFLRDLEEGPKRGLVYDREAADLAAEFFPGILTLTVGEFEGKPFELLPWQHFLVRNLYGWKREDGTRRFRRAYIETSKGSGKTPLAAGLAIRSICGDGEPRAETYILARTADQALITFRYAAAFAESPALADRLSTLGGQNPYRVIDRKSASFIQRLSSDQQGRGKSGPLPHHVIVDEYHEHETSAMRDMYVAGTKHRRQPLSVVITNAGVGLQSPCGIEHLHALSVLQGQIEADSYFAAVYSVDEDDKPMDDESVWIKANPSLPIIPGYNYIREQVEEARGMASKRSVVERLNFSRWVDAETPWVDPETWAECEVETLPENLKEKPCVIALDLSTRHDLTAAATVWWDLDEGDEAPTFWLESTAWTPSGRLQQRAQQDAMPYPTWAEEGHLIVQDGETIRYTDIADWIVERMAVLDLRAVIFDKFRIDLIEAALEERGVPTTREEMGGALHMINHPQGFQSGPAGKDSDMDALAAASRTSLWMPRSIDSAEELIIERRLRAKINPVLRAAVLGMIIVEDAAGNRRPQKKKSTVRIDAGVAAVMALGGAYTLRKKWHSAIDIDGLI